MYDVDELKQKRICSECVREDYLKDQINKDGQDACCSYCGQEDKTFTIEQMADRVQAAFEQHYERTSDEPSAVEWIMQKDKESTYEWEREGDATVDAIGGAALIDELPARDIQEVLEDRYSNFESMKIGDETEFAASACYVEKGPDTAELRAEWGQFEEALKKTTRFFSREASATLERIFKDLPHLQTRNGERVVVSAGPSTPYVSFFRARAFEADADLEDALKHPEQKLGTPPSDKAKDGRMNARGIAVFYGANDPTVALAEVRPPVGSKVLVGRFDLIRPLQLLNLKALQEIGLLGSIFDPTYIQRLERAAFLASLSKRITIPVMPSDEPFEYLATQAIADFLATEATPPLDGILFPSVQSGADKKPVNVTKDAQGKYTFVQDEIYNVVLFHKAARVQESDLPKDAKLAAQIYHSTEEGPEIDYTVWEEVPPPAKATPKTSNSDWDPVWSTAQNIHKADLRDPALKLDTDSLAVHHIKGVVFETERHEVTRKRSVLSDQRSDF